MARVTAQEFWHAYRDGLRTRGSWASYQSQKARTTCTREVAVDVIRSKGLIPSTEYFRVDVIGEEEVDRRFNWLLRVAFEHENGTDRWMAELCKLAHVVADLRVLASYHDFRSPQTAGQVLQARVTRLLEPVDRMNRVPGSEWLFIFGPKPFTAGPLHPFLAFTTSGPAVVPLADDIPLNPIDWPDYGS